MEEIEEYETLGLSTGGYAELLSRFGDPLPDPKTVATHIRIPFTINGVSQDIVNPAQSR